MNETLAIQVIMDRNSNLSILNLHSSINREVSSFVSRITHLVSIDVSAKLVLRLVLRITKSTFLHSFLSSIFMSSKIPFVKHILDLLNYK